jgi:hypothetical protein
LIPSGPSCSGRRQRCTASSNAEPHSKRATDAANPRRSCWPWQRQAQREPCDPALGPVGVRRCGG